MSASDKKQSFITAATADMNKNGGNMAVKIQFLTVHHRSDRFCRKRLLLAVCPP